MTSEVRPESRSAVPISYRILPGRVDPREQEALASPSGSAADERPNVDALVQAARYEADREGFARAAAGFEHQIAQERLSLTRWMEQFTQEKQRYFSEVEGEVVRLSLAIAERILHREASMDPLLLAGVARVALQQVGEGSEAVLRVPPAELPAWKEVFRRRTDEVDVVEDERLSPGDCLLETRSGSVHLGVRAQLQEIERGFFELLQRRPVAEWNASREMSGL